MKLSEKEVFILDRTNSITSYTFLECLTLLKKLQQLDSLVLQSAYYQYIILTLEERIKSLAHRKNYPLTAALPDQANRVMV